MPVTRRKHERENVEEKSSRKMGSKDKAEVKRSTRVLRQVEMNSDQNVKPPARKRKKNDDHADENDMSPSYQPSAKKGKSREPKIKPEIKSSSSDHDASQSDSENEAELFSYEQIREANLKANAEFFQQLGILEAKQHLEESVSNRRKPTQRGLKREKAPVEKLPPRRSLRIQNVGPPKPLYVPEELTPSFNEHERPPAGPLSMEEYLIDQLKPEYHTQLSSYMCKSCVDSVDIKPLSSDLKRFMKDFSQISITEDRVAKVVKDRIFSLAIHPTDDKVLVAAGDKWGKIGFWDVLSREENDGVVAYTPHSRPVNHVYFPPWNPLTLYSCSYDGSLRCAHFERGVFDEVYSCPEDVDLLLRNFDFHSEQVLLVAQTDGCVALVDTRTPQKNAEKLYPCHLKYLRTVSVHPVEKNYFVTASVDTTVCLWDLRKMSEKKNTPVASQRHGKSVDSAYFSPVTGKYILTASADNTLNVFDSSKLNGDLKLKKSLKHDNHVGRWLTKFRATWHPARDDLFVVGSMKRPRQIELYDDSCQEMKILTNPDYLGSVCSLNVIHPSRNIVAGGNSSGRVHVFM